MGSVLKHPENALRQTAHMVGRLLGWVHAGGQDKSSARIIMGLKAEMHFACAGA